MNTLSIDFGTSYCSAAYMTANSAPVSVPFGLNQYSSLCYKFPTVIQYALNSKGEEVKVVGEMALRNLIQSNKSDVSIISKIKTELREHSGYIVNGKPKKSVQIVSDIFSYIKQIAEAETDLLFDEVIITHPAQYESTKQNILKEAASMCGFIKNQLLEEPKAAAYAFIREHKIPQNSGCLVFDYGGGTVDVAYLKYEENGINFKFPPKGISGCGGEYIDLLLHNNILCRLGESTNTSISPLLLDNCTQMKINFSKYNNGKIIYANKAITFTLDEFNSVIYPKTNVALEVLRDVINICNNRDLPVNYIFMNGGSSKLNCVRKGIKDLVPKAEMLDYSGDDIAVSLGALLFLKENSSEYNQLQLDNNIEHKHGVPIVDSPILRKLKEQRKQYYNSKINQ